MQWMGAEEVIKWHDEQATKGATPSHRIATADADALDTFGHLAFLRGNCVYAVEEAALVFQPGERISGWCKNIVFVGRHRDVSLLVTAQRAASIPIALRSQATRIVSFAQTEGDDVSWLKGCYGEEVKNLPKLPPLECLDAHQGNLTRYSIK